MSVQLKPTGEIKARLGLEPNGRVQSFFTNTCYKHMDKYVPNQDGQLRTNVDIKPDSITYQSPYAHYMYKGEVMGPNYPIKQNGIIVGWFSPKGQPKHYTGKSIVYKTSGTGPYWDKRMVSAEIDDVIKEVQNYVGGKR